MAVGKPKFTAVLPISRMSGRTCGDFVPLITCRRRAITMTGFLLLALTVLAPPTYQPENAIAHDQPFSAGDPLVVSEIEQRGGGERVLLLVLFVAAGLLLTGLSVPLIFRKIPPNPWYGFRVRATLENEEVWYPANGYAGKRLFWVGIGTVVSALVMFLLPIRNIGVYASAVGGIVMLGLAVAVIQSFLYLRTLSPKE